MTILLCAASHCRLRGRHTTTCPGEQCRGCMPARAQDGLRLCPLHLQHLHTDPSAAAELWAELALHLTGTGSSNSEIRSSNPQPGLTINLGAAETRMHIRAMLTFNTRLIADERGIMLPSKPGPWELIALPQNVQGPLARRRTRTVDHSTYALGQYVSTHATWLAAHISAGELSYQLHNHISRARSLRQASATRIVQIGPCPQVGETGQCAGTLRGLLRPTDSLLPSAVTCDVDETHSWDSTQWTKLGRTMKGRAA